MHIREMRDGDKEYMLKHFRSDVAEILAPHGEKAWEAIGLDEMDHVFVIEDAEGNCGSLMFIKKTEEDEEGTACSWLIPGDMLEKNPIAFLRLTYLELGRTLLEAGPYRLLWSYVASNNQRNIDWAVRWLGCEIVARNLEVPGRDIPMHKVVLTRELLERRGRRDKS